MGMASGSSSASACSARIAWAFFGHHRRGVIDSDGQAVAEEESQVAWSGHAAGREGARSGRRRACSRRPATSAARPAQRTGWPARRERLLDVGDPQRAEVEDRRGQHGVRAGLDRGREVLGRARAAGGDHRDRDLTAYGADQLEVEAVLGAVGVHRVEQDLAGAQLGRADGPLDRVEPGRLPAAVGGDLEAGRRAGRDPAGVDREHQHLVAEPVGDLGDQLGPVDRGGVDRDLVGAGAQQPVDVLDRRPLPRRRSAG